jgi:membrane associated rhomboid family serine protease
MSSPDLFVVCKSCGSEVSPYVTECPYCGSRLRKRAPKIEREGGRPRPAGASAGSAPRRPAPAPRLSRLRTGEIPGVSGDETRKPWATIVLVALSFGVWLSLAFFLRADLALASVSGDPWRYLTAPFVNANGWAQFAVVVGLGVFGWLLERRHGPVAVVALFFLSGTGGLAAASVLEPDALSYGTHGAALGFVCAWGVGALRARRAGDDEDDLLGAAVIAAALLLIPLATGMSLLAGALGGVIGLLVGLPLSALHRR